MKKVWVDINEVIENKNELDSKYKEYNYLMRTIPNHDKYEPKKTIHKRNKRKKKRP